MTNDLASANVNRTYQLAATSIAIFTFMLIFLYPRFVNGEIDAWLFQATVVVMATAIFSFVFAAHYYYGASITHIGDADRAIYARRGDRLWLAGITLLLLDPSLILYTVRLVLLGSCWLALWIGYLVFVARYFPRVQTTRR